ncbi:MAG: endonuclease/exonuclease/phosphatase family protein [Prolixibacteraceae bacterium]|nr:endonuclease/exonuclease/phosphatase family protein [Prolixibacteraceae bacterium]
MKRFFFIILIFACNTIMAQNIRIITYNIRYNNPGDGINAWPNRSAQVAALLDFHQAEIFGLQEALIGQIEDIQAKLPNMKWVGVGRDDGKKAGEYSPLFYNSKKFKGLKSGYFWLSETPEKPGLGWDAACNRICTWLLLETDKKDKQFMVFNTHFDHQGIKARTESAKLILKKIKELNTSKLPVILTGDFNLTPEQEPIAVITKELKDSRAITKDAPYGPIGTFNGFKFDAPLKERIDFIFVNDKVEVKQYAVLADSKDLRYPSDHLPIFVNIELKSGKK